MLSGNKLFLRALEPEDIDVLFAWENDVSIWELSNTLVPFSKKILKDYLDQSHLDIYTTKQLRLVICLKAGNPIGLIDLFDFDPKNLRAGIGILIADKNLRNKGYASEALEIMKVYCKEKLNLHQVYCSIVSANTASLKLFKKCGFEISGTKLEWQKTKSGFQDEHFLQCLLH